MAWLKEIEIEETGVKALFWEKISIFYSHYDQKSVFKVGGWVSAAAYAARKLPLKEMTWEVPSGLAPELAAGADAFLTAYARAQPEFEGATDYVPEEQ